jgi:hypothetical protein
MRRVKLLPNIGRASNDRWHEQAHAPCKIWSAGETPTLETTSVRMPLKPVLAKGAATEFVRLSESLSRHQRGQSQQNVPAVIAA